MIFGKMKQKSRKLPVLLGLVVPLLCQSAQTEQRHTDIVAELARNEITTVRFKERLEAFYLDAPLISTGIMRFEPPDKLTKIISEPEHITQQIEGDDVIVTWGNNKTERFSMSRHSGLQGIANTLRSLLSGNVSYINANYVVEYFVKQDAWKLVLIPKKENLSKWIKKIEAEGAGSNIRQYTVIEVNGDHTTTIFYEE